MSAILERDFGTPPSHATQTVTLEIDGMAIVVPAGTSVMRAAAEAGVSVPKLCATDTLEAFGSCRLCLVEIEGRAGTPASCTTPVAEGMKVRTALVTARSAPAHERAIRTLMSWDIQVDEAMFLGGLAKGEFLREFEPDFFFDDQTGHVDSAAEHVPAGHVAAGVSNRARAQAE